jgi:hypothetical protein
MYIFKTTEEISSNFWEIGQIHDDDFLPIKEEWLEKTSPVFEDIKLWEQLHFEPGNLGLYIAYNPYVELYLIVFNLLSTETKEIFYSAEQTKERLEEFGVTLNLGKLWMSSY